MEMLSNPQQLGLATLILVAAIFIGVGAGRLVPRDRGRTLVGLLAALAFTGGLAYLGIDTAVYVLWLFMAAAVAAALFAMVA